jgi:hypothetical protein
LIEPSLEEEKPQEEQEPESEKITHTTRIHSWITPIVGFLMLIIGLLVGYFIYPSVSPLLSKATLTPTASAEAGTSGTNAGQPGLKDYVVAQTTHFMGDANAPVTVIEFSDFQ